MRLVSDGLGASVDGPCDGTGPGWDDQPGARPVLATSAAGPEARGKKILRSERRHCKLESGRIARARLPSHRHWIAAPSVQHYRKLFGQSPRLIDPVAMTITRFPWSAA